MRFIFYSPIHFENWDWRNSVITGIGGSETSHVEMAWRLAKRGHEVISYAPLPDDCPREWRGTSWRTLQEVDWCLPGTWIIYRSLNIIVNFKYPHPDQSVWLMMQDEDIPGQWPKETLDKVDRVLALCSTHAETLAKSHPEIKDKIRRTSNGVKVDLIRQVSKTPIKRNPHKLIYASSPDRGLDNLIKIFKRAREYIDTLELHIFYGFDNIDKLIQHNPRFSHYKKFKERLLKLTDSPGIHLRGRVSQTELYAEWLSSGIWCYPTVFSETSCITCMEAQSLGAIPITNPYWALKDNVKHGIFIQGDANSDMLIQARYVGSIVKLASDEALQEKIRNEMMLDTQCNYNWERLVDQWEASVLGITHPHYYNQFAFQIKHMTGKTLNVGADSDLVDLKSLGVTNLDVVKQNPITGRSNKADIVADIRYTMPKELEHNFDSVIMGDIIEHMSFADGVKALANAKRALQNGGQIIITCPEDYRPVSTQHLQGNGNEVYASGVSAYHERAITKNELNKMINQAGLESVLYREIDYTHFTGHGVLCVDRK